LPAWCWTRLGTELTARLQALTNGGPSVGCRTEVERRRSRGFGCRSDGTGWRGLRRCRRRAAGGVPHAERCAVAAVGAVGMLAA
jgi:hypothetical protein